MRTAITAVVGSILCSKSAALVVPLRAARPAQALDIALPRVSDGASVHLGDALSATTEKTLLVLGTHTADFNAIEYPQKIRFHKPRLRAAGVPVERGVVARARRVDDLKIGRAHV